jgi:anti-sigma factor RsiW
VNCREFVDFLMRYLDDELDAPVREAFDQHLGACPQCVTYLDTYRETVRMGELCGGEDEAPAEVPEALVQAILATRGERT